MEINKFIFREYDIRGIYNKDLNEEVAYLIGRSFGTKLKSMNKETTLVGYDNRVSSPILEKSLIKGINDSGINVVRLGLVTSPMYYYASDFLNIKCGIMITASHNPKEYNGFKISYNGIHNAFGKDIYELYEIIEKKTFSEGTGIVKDFDIKEEYIKLLTSDIHINKRLKVVYDCGNGTTSIIAKDILNKFDLDLIPLFDISDPDFPNHHPDPCVEENLTHLKEKVLETKADIGIAFDGDGDRIGIVDELGNMIDIDKYMIIIWRDIYNKVKNKKALYDVKCSRVLYDELIKLGIEPVEYRTGNSYTKEMSVRGDFPFGGEYSGHVFFRDKFPGYDDGIYGGLRIIEILSNTDKKLSQLLDGINKYYSTKELKMHVEDSKKFNLIENVKEYCINKGYNISLIDGVKVRFDDNSSACVRASNTGPSITYRYEAKTPERLKEIETEFNTLLNKLNK